MKRTVTQLGKVGNVVWGKNRFGQTCYELVIPANPRTPVQQANRGQFGEVSGRWRRLTQEQRDLWAAAGARHQSRRRLGRSGPLSGFNYFVQVNMKRVKRGLALREVPPAARGRHASAMKARLELRGRAALGQVVPCSAEGRAGEARGSEGGGIGNWQLKIENCKLRERGAGAGSRDIPTAPQSRARLRPGCRPGWRTGAARGGGGGAEAWRYGSTKEALRYPKRVGTVWAAGCRGPGGAWEWGARRHRLGLGEDVQREVLRN